MLHSRVPRAFRAITVVAAILGGLLSPAAASAEEVRLKVQYATAAGTTFAYAKLGSGAPLLMLNGTGSPMNEWDPALLAQLQNSRQVIVVDYPGLGLSGPAPSRWSFAKAADWMADFTETIAPGEQIDVLGWSMGGFVAQQLAVRHPDLIRKLVLAATNPGGPNAQLGPLWVQKLDSASDEGDQAFLKTNFPETPAAQSKGRAFLMRLAKAVKSGAYPGERVPMATYNAMVAAEDPWLSSAGNARALRTLRTPTLVITGAADVVTPAQNSRDIARMIPGAQLKLVSGAGHSFLFQDPARTARTVDSFLSDSQG